MQLKPPIVILLMGKVSRWPKTITWTNLKPPEIISIFLHQITWNEFSRAVSSICQNRNFLLFISNLFTHTFYFLYTTHTSLHSKGHPQYHTHPHIRTHTHTCTHAEAQTHPNTHLHTYTQTQAWMPARSKNSHSAEIMSLKMCCYLRRMPPHARARSSLKARRQVRQKHLCCKIRRGSSRVLGEKFPAPSLKSSIWQSIVKA